jgi:hypothetical protein
MFGEPTMEENAIGLEDLETKIYRIFSLDRFSKMIVSRQNGLVHPSKWDDPFENFFLKGEAVMPDGTPVSLSHLSESWYGQCWTRNRDSDAMWRIYSADKTGVRVETTVRALFSDFYAPGDKFASLKYLIGSVEYKQREEIERFLADTTFTDLALGGQPHRFAKTLLIKRPEFSHENEVRLLFHDAESGYGHNGVAIFPFNWDAILTEVALDPRLLESDFEVEKQKLASLGCTVPITQSELYKFTPAKIRLG